MNRLGAALIALGTVAVTFVAGLVGTTTHDSHLRDLKYAHEEMVRCIATDRSAAECRVIVYGAY